LTNCSPPPTRYPESGEQHVGNIALDVLYAVKAHPEYVAIFLLFFIGLAVLFHFVLEIRLTPETLILEAMIAIVLTALLLYGMEKRKKQKL
jgi:predicted tellurium resistance membrane protein TerC